MELECSTKSVITGLKIRRPKKATEKKKRAWYYMYGGTRKGKKKNRAEGAPTKVKKTQNLAKIKANVNVAVKGRQAGRLPTLTCKPCGIGRSLPSLSPAARNP